MTRAMITVDAELSLRMHQQGVAPRANFESSILGRTRQGDFGVGWQMDVLDARGLTGVYFVDPFPALVYGPAIIADIVGPIRDRGHEVQLHIHTEWLQWAKDAPVATKGPHIACFGQADQVTLLTLARDLLIEAGAPPPTSFRAGNFGANEDTLVALATLGMAWDTSFNAAWAAGPCGIQLSTDQIAPIRHLGVGEVPVSGVVDARGFRPAQVCALSTAEMSTALSHATVEQQPLFMIVTHSFEMLSRDRTRPNGVTMARFKNLCRAIERHPQIGTSGFADLELALADMTYPAFTHARSGAIQMGARMAGQLYANVRYERTLNPV